jgi:cytochrome P450
MLTRYQDVNSALRKPRQFSSATGVEIEKRAEQIPQSARANFDIEKRFWYTTMRAADPPRHTDQGQSVMNPFAPQAKQRFRQLEQKVTTSENEPFYNFELRMCRPRIALDPGARLEVKLVLVAKPEISA